MYQWSAESTSTAPNDRPITAVAVWYTGSPPGTSAGKRTRSSRSFSRYPSTWVRNSTRSASCHSTVSWVTSSPSSVNEATNRDPAGHRSVRTVAGTDDEPVPGPLGDRCHGPSPCLGCCAYSSWMTSSLPGPASTPAPVRLSVTLTVPPRVGSAVTRYRSFSMAPGPALTCCHCAADSWSCAGVT